MLKTMLQRFKQPTNLNEQNVRTESTMKYVNGCTFLSFLLHSQPWNLMHFYKTFDVHCLGVSEKVG